MFAIIFQKYKLVQILPSVFPNPRCSANSQWFWQLPGVIISGPSSVAAWLLNPTVFLILNISDLKKKNMTRKGVSNLLVKWWELFFFLCLNIKAEFIFGIQQQSLSFELLLSYLSFLHFRHVSVSILGARKIYSASPTVTHNVYACFHYFSRFSVFLFGQS